MAQINSTSKSMGYDHPSYTARQAIFLQRAAAANGTSAKYTAHANLLATALSISTIAVGAATSSYTFTGANGTATVAALSDQLSLIVTQPTSTGTGSIVLSTTTYGPITVGAGAGGFLNSGTYTNQIGQVMQVQLNTSTGTAGLGGVTIPQGAMFYIQGGTDTGASEAITLDYQVLPLAAVPA